VNVKWTEVKSGGPQLPGRIPGRSDELVFIAIKKMIQRL
jgi:hypothetical protein